MRFTLVVPGLLDWPSPALASIEKNAPALAWLVAAGGSPASEQDGSVATACRVCGIAKQDDWPVAPWLARAQGIDTAGGYWLCAEPARFVVGHSDVRLAALIDDIEPAEAESLLATLNAHFAAERIRFVAPTSSRWFVCAENPARISTRPPAAALGAPLLEYLPAGADGSRWRRWQNELQMLLFEHAVNRRREANGRPPIDGVWLWGGGTLAQPAVPDSRLFANGGLVRVLGSLAGLAPAALPATFDALPQTAPVIVWLDSIEADADAAAAQLSTLEHAWTGPAERGLCAGTIDEMELVLTASALGLDFRIPRPTLVQRWKRRFVSPQVSSQLARWVGEAHGA